MKTEFYLCDVCGAEMDPHGPCHVAVEVRYPREYVGRYDPAGRYVCPGCMPLRHYKPTSPKTPARAKVRFWNLLVGWSRDDL